MHIQSVVSKHCIVLDYARGKGHVLLNDLIRFPSPQLLPIVPEDVVEDELAALKQEKMQLLGAFARGSWGEGRSCNSGCRSSTAGRGWQA